MRRVIYIYPAPERAAFLIFFEHLHPARRRRGDIIRCATNFFFFSFGYSAHKIFLPVVFCGACVFYCSTSDGRIYRHALFFHAFSHERVLQAISFIGWLCLGFPFFSSFSVSVFPPSFSISLVFFITLASNKVGR